MRNRFVGKLLSMILALSMLLSAGASAETVRLEIDLNSVLGALDGAVTIYDDEDGCSGLLLEEKALGEILIQLGESIVFGNDETGYREITMEELSAAIGILSLVLEDEMPLEDAVRMFNYRSSEAYMEDAVVIEEITAILMNMLGNAAMMQGILQIHEDGTIVIDVTLEGLRALSSVLIQQIMAYDELLDMIYGLNVWEALGKDPEETFAEMNAQSVELSVFGANMQDAAFYFKMDTQGNVNTELYMLEAESGVSHTLLAYVDVSGIGAKYMQKDGSGTTLYELYEIAEEIRFGAHRSGEEHDTFGLNITLNEEDGLDAHGKMDIHGKTGTFTLGMSPEKTELDGNYQFENTSFTVFLNDKPFEGDRTYKITLKQGEEYAELLGDRQQGALQNTSFLYEVGGAVQSRFQYADRGADGKDVSLLWGGENGKSIDMTILAGDTVSAEGTFKNAGGEYPCVRPFAMRIDERGNIIFTYESDGGEAYTDHLTVVLTKNETGYVGTVQYALNRTAADGNRAITLNGKVRIEADAVYAEAIIDAENGSLAPEHHALTITGSAGRGECTLVSEVGGVTQITSSCVREENGCMYIECRQTLADALTMECEIVFHAEEGSLKIEAAAPAYGIGRYVREITALEETIYAEGLNGEIIAEASSVVTADENGFMREVEGFMYGVSYAEKYGFAKTGENSWRGFAEYEVGGDRFALEIPVSAVTLDGRTAVTAEVSVLSEDVWVKYFSATFTNEESENEAEATLAIDALNEEGVMESLLALTVKGSAVREIKPHISGEKMTREELAETLLRVLGAYLPQN